MAHPPGHHPPRQGPRRRDTQHDGELQLDDRQPRICHGEYRGSIVNVEASESREETES
jgi:hypothetical protein